jgi:beta-lactamase superfamily II metal-dependent hydrolase
MAEKFLRIEMLPARHGDCLWLEYGQGRKTNRVLIDGGPVDTYPTLERRIAQVPRGERTFELVMLTHVDADHVEGLVRFFAQRPTPMAVRQVWFNGWRQMQKSHGLLGAVQGEFLSALLVKRARHAWKASAPPWVVPAKGKLPTTTLEGGLKLTLLSPNVARLKAMAKAWEKAVVKAGFDAGDLEAAWRKLATQRKFLPKEGLLGATPSLDRLLKAQFIADQAKPNGSSIAVLAEFGPKRALLLADAHPGVVAESLTRLCAERGVTRLKVDAVKVSHHGSKNNTSTALLQLIDCPRWLVSSNGDHFDHPDDACMARLLRYAKPKELWFNYDSARTKVWIKQAAQDKHHYVARVRKDTELAAVVDL